MNFLSPASLLSFLIICLLMVLVFKFIKHKTKPAVKVLKRPKDWPPPPSPRGATTSRSRSTIINKSNTPKSSNLRRRVRNNDEGDEGLDIVEMALAAELISELLEDTPQQAEFYRGGEFGGAGASGSYNDEPVKTTESYSSPSYSSGSWGGGSDSCSDSSNCSGGRHD